MFILITPLVGQSNSTQIQIKVSMDITSLINLTTDCLRFVTEFFEVISQSAQHIYHSALQLAPHSSLVWELYSQHIGSRIARIVTGAPSSWDSCTASAGVTECHCAVWSPCGNFIALGSLGKATIHDSATLEILSVPNTPKDISHNTSDIRSLAFSPNGSLLVGAFSYNWPLLGGKSMPSWYYR